ncbi:hypothetical protein INS49_004842 [Diaporthe citri]|uniref:uncharacterized protein n=1 Tax=Diaporthe citri TaxID=83186 RepID=UPI001C80CFC8|nr:uncharacterized protein INS49_004842 [Diaporthe citri]KAG6354238.1 hypothetical protein INS49_004842 [Diaporthe citri]
MFSKSGTFLVAILLAYSASAAPLSAAQPHGVQPIIDAIKAQLNAQNVSDSDVVVDKTEAHHKDGGFLSDETISDLNEEIKFMTSEGGMSSDEIAEELVDDLRSVDAIQKRDQLGIAKDTLVIEPDIVKRVMARKVEARTPCPPFATHGTGSCCPS